MVSNLLCAVEKKFIDFLETVCMWLSGIFGMVIFLKLIYEFLKSSAKQSAKLLVKKRSEALTVREAQLKQEQENFCQKLLRYNKEHNTAQEKIAQRENEIKIAQQKVAETFRNAEHIREMAEIKIKKIEEINQQLRLAISAARQRAKRLAMKHKSPS